MTGLFIRGGIATVVVLGLGGGGFLGFCMVLGVTFGLMFIN